MRALKPILYFIIGIGFFGFFFGLFRYIMNLIVQHIDIIYTPTYDFICMSFSAMIVGAIIALGIKNANAYGGTQ